MEQFYRDINKIKETIENIDYNYYFDQLNNYLYDTSNKLTNFINDLTKQDNNTEINNTEINNTEINNTEINKFNEYYEKRDIIFKSIRNIRALDKQLNNVEEFRKTFFFLKNLEHMYDKYETCGSLFKLFNQLDMNSKRLLFNQLEQEYIEIINDFNRYIISNIGFYDLSDLYGETFTEKLWTKYWNGNRYDVHNLYDNLNDEQLSMLFKKYVDYMNKNYLNLLEDFV